MQDSSCASPTNADSLILVKDTTGRFSRDVWFVTRSDSNKDIEQASPKKDIGWMSSIWNWF